MMRSLLAALSLILVLGLLGTGCSKGFGELGFGKRLVVTFVDDGTGLNHGTRDRRLPISVVKPYPLHVAIEVQNPDGTRDTSFNSFVRISAKPGTVQSVDSPTADGRNVQLVGGFAENVSVNVLAAYGDTRIWVDDIGYIPADPLRTPPPECSDGRDNNGDHLIDFPADPGCAFANDDAENNGTLAAGTSPTIYFAYPRIRDVRGWQQGGASTPFPNEQVVLDTGFLQEKNAFAFSVVVTRIATDGFYVTDISDKDRYGSVFIFNFSSPPGLRVCDRLTGLTGTAADFFGFTELGFPTWGVEQWNPAARKCLVPDPFVLDTSTLNDTASLYRYIASLVRIQSGDLGGRPNKLRVAPHFGPEHPTAPGYFPEENASNCDFDGDGSVDFYTDPEKTCAANCTSDPNCSEWSSYAGRSDFHLVLRDEGEKRTCRALACTAECKTGPCVGSVCSQTGKINAGRPCTSNDACRSGICNRAKPTDTSDTCAPKPCSADSECDASETCGTAGTIQANATSFSQFRPFDYRGKTIKSLTGTLRYFSGGAQFTIEARCPADVVLDPDKEPVPMDQACVQARSEGEINPGQ
jgi:hypothetical protein